MERQSLKLVVCLVAIVGVVFLFTAEASATPIGLLRMDSGSGGVTVGLDSIDWTPPTGGGSGAFVVGIGTTLTSAVGNPTVGTFGTLLDLSGSTVLPLANFMTFAAAPGLGFDLAFVGPGSANTNCAGLGIGDSCSIFVGSPVILTFTSTGTTVALAAGGIARDGTTPSNWLGNFTTQIASQTPLQIQNQFGCTPGLGTAGCTNKDVKISSTYSGEFVAAITPVPEPASLGLLGIGVASLAFAFRKKK